VESHPPAEDVPCAYDVHNGQTESERRDREVRTLQPERRQTENKSEKGGDKSRQGKRQYERDVEMGHEKNRSVRSDGEKTGMSQRYLSRVSDKYVEAHGKYHVDNDDIEEVNMVIRHIQGKGEEKEEKDGRPEENHTTADELNIFVILPLHIHEEHLSLQTFVKKGIRVCAQDSRVAAKKIYGRPGNPPPRFAL